MNARARLNLPRRDFGFVEWFRPGDHARTEAIVEELASAGVPWLRTHLSWAEYFAPGGPEWFDWLLPRLSRRFDLLPCIHYTPPSISRNGKTNGPPHRLKDYADFVDVMLSRYGQHFGHVELWNEPNNLLDWDWRLDTDFDLFCEMVGGAAYWVQHRGWKAVLGGPSPFDPYWLDLMGKRGVLGVVAAVGFHGFPGTWDSETASWGGWDLHLGEMRRILERYNDKAEIWVTETGYSTWRNDEAEQARRFLAALDVPAERVYWYGWRDIPHDVPVQEGLWFDARHYHLGATDPTGRPKLLARFLREGGVDRVRTVAKLGTPVLIGRKRPYLVTGGAGFIGCNLSDSLLADGEDVIVIDNLSRPGVEQNLTWLRDRHGSRVHPVLTDIRDHAAIAPAFRDARGVFHLAAQTAVTTSLDLPVEDFEVNARGTLNVLEAVRAAGRALPVVFASTNKVYGALEDIALVEKSDRYAPADSALATTGVGEDRPLSFCTPYGCSKGVADQYVLDYAKSYDIPSAVLRMSCIYGPRQFGTEDQGWVAHFLIRALRGEPITIYGDGKQVRDVLHVADAVRAYRSIMASILRLEPRVFNLGGGPGNAVSLNQVIAHARQLLRRDIAVAHEDWRKGDQAYFVADTRRLAGTVDWKPEVGWKEGIADLARWLEANRREAPAAQPRKVPA